MKKACLLLVALAAIGTTSAHAEVYKWIDEDGNVHFTDTPPPNQETEEVRIQGAGTSSATRSSPRLDSKSGSEDASGQDASVRELCNRAVSNLRRFSTVWEQKIRAKMPGMAPEERQAAQKAIVDLKTEVRKAQADMSLCTRDMADPTSRRQAECIANAPDADSAMFCVM